MRILGLGWAYAFELSWIEIALTGLGRRMGEDAAGFTTAVRFSLFVFFEGLSIQRLRGTKKKEKRKGRDKAVRFGPGRCRASSHLHTAVFVKNVPQG